MLIVKELGGGGGSETGVNTSMAVCVVLTLAFVD